MQLPDQVFSGHPYIAKHQPTGAAAPGAHKAVAIFGLDAGAALHHDGADALVLMRIFIKIGAAIHQKNIRLGCPHHKALLSIEHKLVAVYFRSGGPVRASALMYSPFRIGFKNSSFCSSVPN